MRRGRGKMSTEMGWRRRRDRERREKRRREEV